MRLTPKVKEILSWYESDNPGVKTNLARLLMHGRLAGSGKLVILPVDHRDLHRHALERACGGEAAEAAADDHDPRKCRFR